MASSRRTDYVVTNDLSQSDVSATRQACSSRWKVEQLHREAKQLTGLEKCQMSPRTYRAESHRCGVPCMGSPDAERL